MLCAVTSKFRALIPVTHSSFPRDSSTCNRCLPTSLASANKIKQNRGKQCDLSSKGRLLQNRRGITCASFDLRASFRHQFSTTQKENFGIPMAQWWNEGTVAVVTGANKGIGYEIASLLVGQGITVVLTARDEERGQKAAAKLAAETGRQVSFHQLDITSPSDCDRLAHFIKAEYGHLDILVNNAGMAYKGATFGPAEARLTIETNVYGTMNVCETLKPLLHSSTSNQARIVNVCSMAGKQKIVGEPLRSHFKTAQSKEEVKELMEKFIHDVERFCHKQEGWSNSMYGVSKLGEATYTRILAKDLESREVIVNACCPGWCATDMSSWKGPKSAAQGADTPVWLALAPPDFPTGGFYADRGRQPF